jgi:SprT protein
VRFLITLMHELAHLITYVQHKHSVKPHGQEWKDNFKRTLGPFLHKEIFPHDIEAAVIRYLTNPAAATCSDIPLSKVLAKYDRNSNPDVMLIDDLPPHARFMYGRERRIFIKGAKNRTRYKCKEEKTGHEYLFNPLVKVKLLKD